MRKYESQVQTVRYKVIYEITKFLINKEFDSNRHKLPKAIIPGDKPHYRCCVYKEREIIANRIDLAVDPIGDTIIEIIDIACDECPVNHYKVTEACRGCLAHKCVQVCPKDAIEVKNGKSIIDENKCVRCGRCVTACPYNAITEVIRPCIKSCVSKAIEVADNNKVRINRDKCTNCGSCVSQCPFGAVVDRSEIIPVIKALEDVKESNENNIYAVIAPSIASQYNMRIGKVVSAIKKLGFKDVVEAALGADIVSYYETMEFVDRVVKGGEACLMTSCCPSFVNYVNLNYKELSPYISTMVSPMIVVSRLIKKMDPGATVVFVGPCTSKKAERRETDLLDATDYVLTFEELEAIIDAYGIDINSCDEAVLDNASHFGRLFARSGGVKDAIKQVLIENDMTEFDFNPIACNGIQEVTKALKLLKAKKNAFNFIEGMACVGGCIGGAVCLTHKDNKMVDEYASLAKERNIQNTLKVLDLHDINMHRTGH